MSDVDFRSRIFLTFRNSASGFIGFPAAQALARAGHNVYGQTRSSEKAAQLTKEESKSLFAIYPFTPTPTL